MFDGAPLANPNVTNWDTSSVTNMQNMFSRTSSANPDVSRWDTSNVTNMQNMFSRATSVTPDMSQWDFSSVTNMSNMFLGVTLPTANYSAMLNRINATSSKSSVSLHGGNSKYDDSASTSRSILVGRSWTITDGGFDTGGKFVTVWRTTIPGQNVTLPLRSGYNYNFTVDWGDGSATSTITAHNDPDITHTYANAGTYTVIIDGTVEAWYFNNRGSKNTLMEVLDLGDVGWKNLERAFYGCDNLTTFAGGDVSGVTNMSRMF